MIFMTSPSTGISRARRAKLYIGAQYNQHNPFVPNGVAPFVEHFEGYFRDHPKSHAGLFSSQSFDVASGIPAGENV